LSIIFNMIRVSVEIDVVEFSRRFDERDFSHYVRAFEIIRDFYSETAADGLAMLLFLG
jgi:hypothetical protein